MYRCPKCASTNVNGPRYVQGTWKRGESLVYTCNRCGYSEYSPTMDAEKKPDPLAGLHQPSKQ